MAFLPPVTMKLSVDTTDVHDAIEGVYAAIDELAEALANITINTRITKEPAQEAPPTPSAPRCMHPISRCVEAGQHHPLCLCVLDLGHAGPHTSSI